MSTHKVIIAVDGPILAGTLSQVRSKCGKPSCRCHSGNEEDLHGPYRRWSGYIDGRLSVRTLSPEAARECERRIANYRKLQAQLTAVLEKALEHAPWLAAEKTNGRKSR